MDDANVIISTDKRGLNYFDSSNYECKIINTPKLNNILLLPTNLILCCIFNYKIIFLSKR